MAEFRKVRVVLEETLPQQSTKPSDPAISAAQKKIDSLKGNLDKVKNDSIEKKSEMKTQTMIDSGKIENDMQNKIDSIQGKIANTQNFIASKSQQAIREEMDVKQRFFIDKAGTVIKYMLEGERVVISPELKEIAKQLKADFSVKDILNKIAYQLSASEPNQQMLSVLKYKIESRMKEISNEK
jgi:hypothetical protein